MPSCSVCSLNRTKNEFHMIDAFCEYIAVEKKYSPLTVRAYADALNDFCVFSGKELSREQIGEVTEEDVREWMMYLIDEKKNAPRSVQQKLTALHSFYKFALRQQAVDKDVTRRIRPPKADKPLPVFFRPTEMAAATQYEKDADTPESIRDCLIIEMLFQTGMRRAELVGLQDKDVDTQEKQIRVLGKRRKERLIPIGDNLCRQIEDYRRERGVSIGTFFVDWKKNGEVKPLDRDKLYRIVTKRMGEVTSLKKHSPHVFRHTFATEMLNNGADIRTIQTLLGHASLAATEVYSHTTFEQLQKAYKQAHPRAGKNQ